MSPNSLLVALPFALPLLVFLAFWVTMSLSSWRFESTLLPHSGLVIDHRERVVTQRVWLFRKYTRTAYEVMISDSVHFRWIALSFSSELDLYPIGTRWPDFPVIEPPSSDSR